MLRNDAVQRSIKSLGRINIHNINLSVISKIQNELSTYDLISLVFLLYDVSETATALERLLLLQEVSKNMPENKLNLLHDWAVRSQSRTTWRHEFLEALAVCQLYHVIRKLGFSVSLVKEIYTNNEADSKLNPVKILLYKLCENIDFVKLLKLKKALISYGMHVKDYITCELIFLHLICEQFINIETDENRLFRNKPFNVSKLVIILEKIPDLINFADSLRQIDAKHNFKSSMSDHKSITSNSSLLDSVHFKENVNVLDECVDMISSLIEEKITFSNLKTDANISNLVYEIKNRERVGVCLIFNQEVFYPSKNSIEESSSDLLEDRKGSTKDKENLEITMKSLNFHIETRENRNKSEMMKDIEDVIENNVKDYDSIFVLCILSHGIEGHVYAADSIPVKVKDIQSILDSDIAKKLYCKPKVLLIQACQTSNAKPPIIKRIFSDGPKAKYFLPRSDYLVYWAASPEYEAFRVEDEGSFFINLLCSVLQKHSDREHLAALCTKVNYLVTNVCASYKKAQVPIFECSLRKLLYLKDLKNH